MISFLLIEFDREKPEARRAAIVALVVTVGSSLAFAVSTMLVAARTGTTGSAEHEPGDAGARGRRGQVQRLRGAGV